MAAFHLKGKMQNKGQFRPCDHTSEVTVQGGCLHNKQTNKQYPTKPEFKNFRAHSGIHILFSSYFVLWLCLSPSFLKQCSLKFPNCHIINSYYIERYVECQALGLWGVLQTDGGWCAVLREKAGWLSRLFRNILSQAGRPLSAVLCLEHSLSSSFLHPSYFALTQPSRLSVQSFSRETVNSPG